MFLFDIFKITIDYCNNVHLYYSDLFSMSKGELGLA